MWVYTIKYKFDGNVLRFIAEGFTQTLDLIMIHLNIYIGGKDELYHNNAFFCNLILIGNYVNWM